MFGFLVWCDWPNTFFSQAISCDFLMWIWFFYCSSEQSTSHRHLPGSLRGSLNHTHQNHYYHSHPHRHDLPLLQQTYFTPPPPPPLANYTAPVQRSCVLHSRWVITLYAYSPYIYTPWNAFRTSHFILELRMRKYHVSFPIQLSRNVLHKNTLLFRVSQSREIDRIQSTSKLNSRCRAKSNQLQDFVIRYSLLE